MRLGKRALSAFLSLVMVFTMLPLGAILARADVTQPYYYNACDVTNDSSRISGGKDIQATTNISQGWKSGTDSSLGYVISFWYNPGSTLENRAMFNIGMNSASDLNYKKYFIVFEDGEIRFCYANGNQGNSYIDVVDTARPNTWNGALVANKWQYITIKVTPDGIGDRVDFMVDGNIASSLYDKTGYNINGAGGYSICDYLANETLDVHFFDGFSNHGWSGAAGSVDEFYIQPLHMSIDDAMELYETKMASMGETAGVYKNLGSAYEKYQYASTQLDAYKYGKVTTSAQETNCQTAANQLAAAVVGMYGWNGTFTAINDNGYSNAVYAPTLYYATEANKTAGTGDIVTSSGWGSSNGVNGRIYQPSPVLIYDGTTSMTYPVTAWLHPFKTSVYSKNGRSNYLYPTNSVLSLDWYWCGFDNNEGSEESGATTFSSIFGNGENWIGYSSSTSYEHQFGAKEYYIVNKIIVNGGSLSFANNLSTLASTNWNYEFHDNSGSKTGTVTSSAPLYVLNGIALKNAINTAVQVDITNYKEGGYQSRLNAIDNAINLDLTNIDYSSDVATGASNAASSISTLINQIGATAATDSNYKSLRDALDYEGTISDNTTVMTVAAAYNNGVNDGFTNSTYAPFKTAYETAVGEFAALASNNNATRYPAIGTNDVTDDADDLLDAFGDLAFSAVIKPTIAPASGSTVGTNTTVSLTNNTSSTSADGTQNDVVYYTFTYNDANATTVPTTTVTAAEDATVNITPFENAPADATEVTVQAYIYAEEDNTITKSANETVTYNLVKAPTIDGKLTGVDTGNAKGDTVTVANSAGQSGTLYYRVGDSGSFTAYSSAISLFTDNSSLQTIYAYTDNNGNYSPVSAVTFTRNGAFTVTLTNPDEKGEQFYNSSSIFTVAVDGTYNGVKFDIVADGDDSTKRTIDYSSQQTYPASGYTENSSVTIKVYTPDAPDEAKTFTFFNVDKYDPLIYQESFDGNAGYMSYATASNNSLGVNGSFNTATQDNTISVIAGTKGLDTYDQRKNVMKIAANDTAYGNIMQLDSNPLANSTAKAFIKSNGVTVSFWRYVTPSGETAINTASVDWLNVLNFTKADKSNYTDDTDANHYQYAVLTANGRFSFSEGGNAGGPYVDYFPWACDITNHSTDANHGYWTHIALTVDPNASTLDEGLMVYINGEPHDINSADAKVTKSKNNGFASMTDKEVIDELLDYLTDSNTHVMFGYGAWADQVGYRSNKDLYVDDVRMYATALTQADINNMYTDSHADCQPGYRSSTSHDPTNVTVYTLGADSLTGTTYSGTKTAGDTVGQEFIDYYGVDPSTCEISYYSFGTGMSIYRSDDNVNWTVVGDSKGRCGYQNEDLFGDDYREVLGYRVDNGGSVATPLGWASQGESVNGGDTREKASGHLLWAPHVCYNIDQDKWMYYGSTSAWVSNYSAVFVFTSDDVDRNYDYKQIVIKTASGDTTNAIDACTYYGRNADGSINPDDLYMLYGSWGDIYVKKLNKNGMRAEASDREFGTLLARRNDGSGPGGGEGGYVTYEKNADSATGGYYYFWISPGSNGWGTSGGAYMIRVFRSEYPDRDFEDITGNLATNAGSNPHGNSILSGYNLNCNDYTYTSAGHSSVYSATNDYGQAVNVNAAHTREYAHSGIPTEDGQLTTRQIWLIGNVAIHNPVAYTENGWPVAFPMKYDSTFTTYFKGDGYTARKFAKGDHRGEYNYAFNAFDIQGVYDSNIILQAAEAGHTGAGRGYSANYDSEIIATDELTGVIVKEDTGIGYRFELSYDDPDYPTVTYMTLYRGNSVAAYGVIANTGAPGHATPEFSFVDLTGKHVWGYKYAEIQRDAENYGNQVELDGVIYTHKADDNFSVYGQEISDQINYLNNTSDGERVTTLKVAYPAEIAVNDTSAVTCVNDSTFVEAGYTAGRYWVEYAYGDDLWYTDGANGTVTSITSAQLDLLSEANRADYYRYYVLKGTVSNYFHYFDNEYDPISKKTITGFPEKGLELLITYTLYNDTKATKTLYGEYEFPFVMANPAWAHTMAATRNTQKDTVGNDRRSSIGNFNRFVDSYGEVTPTYSHLLFDVSVGNTEEAESKYGQGTSKYLSNFETAATNLTLNSVTNINDSFNFYSDGEGVNAGAYSVQEHSDTGPNAYTATPDLVNVNYYVDYSDTSQYQSNNSNGLITVNDGVPTGFEFKMKTSNFYWDTATVASIHNVTSYAMNKTGMNISYWSSPATITLSDSSDDSDTAKNAGILATNRTQFYTSTALGRTWHDDEFLFHTDARSSSNANFNTAYRNKLLKYFSDGSTQVALKSGSGGDYIDGTGSSGTPSSIYKYYDYTPSQAYSTASNGKDTTNNWQGVATFTGVNSVHPNTYSQIYDSDEVDISAEEYANYILELGTYHKVTDIGVRGGRFVGNETYHYYNIGVYTCDKGAVREFIDTFANKEFTINGEDGKTFEGKIRGTEDETGDIQAIRATDDILAADYTVKSYNEYLDALGEAYWFVNNPKNTTYTSSVDGKTYEYSVGYDTYYGEDHASIYQADAASKNIFNEGTAAAGSYEARDGGDNKPHTDEVQAEIIAKVIEAYQNLYAVSNYIVAEDVYNSIEIADYQGETDGQIIFYTDKDKETVDYRVTKDNYTDDSWDEFVDLVRDSSQFFDFYTNGNEGTEGYDRVDTDISSWRYATLSGEEYKNLLKIIKNAQSGLMEQLDTQSLSDNYDDKTGADETYLGDKLTDGIYNNAGTEQIKTFDSWYNMNVEAQKANTLLTTAAISDSDLTQDGVNKTEYEADNGETVYFTNGRYKVDAVKAYTFDDYTYYAQEFAPTTFTEDGADNSTKYDAAENCSDMQKDVYDESAALAATTLDDCDTSDAYAAYDAAYSAVQSVNFDKYLETAKDSTKGAAALLADETAKRTSQYNPEAEERASTVYVTLAADEAAVYNEFMGSSILDTTTQYKNTLNAGTDPLTASLLTVFNTVEGNKENYVKKFDITYTVKNGDTVIAEDSDSKYYGETTKAFAIPEVAQKNAKISITYKDLEGNAIGTVKEKTQNGESFSRVAKSNMDITVAVTNKSTGTGAYKVEIKNIYNTVIDIIYVDKADLPEAGSTETLTFGSVATVNPAAVPYYTFSNWTRVVNDADQTASYTPVYNAGQKINFTLAEGTVTQGASQKTSGSTTYSTAFDTEVTIDGSEVDNFYAWATVSSDNLYQIASYSPVYKFFAVYGNTISDGEDADNGEHFVVIKKIGSKYYKPDGETELTAAMVDSVFNINYNADAVLKNKLDNKLPFVSLINAELSAGKKKATAYCRITEGALVTPSEFGSLATSKEANKAYMVEGSATKFKTSTILSSGQYTYSINRSTGFTAVTFRGYMAYAFPYAFTHTSNDEVGDVNAPLNVTEYSGNIAVAK